MCIGVCAAGVVAPLGPAAAEDYESVVTGSSGPTPKLPRHRARSEVTREDMERRLPRSAPDALRYEPGVFVQQTAHSQGSAYIRGLTGQQTLLLFDGIRLNNSTYRQGPNQYFFTLDSQSIESLQVIRGGASTRFGSDALGGVILALPIEPVLRSADSMEFVTYDPDVRWRTATADDESGGRAQTRLTVGDRLAFFGGVGGRRAGLLESGGIVLNPADGLQPLVPRFAKDGRTQKGTGFSELTADGRLVYQLSSQQTLKVAAYAYRLYDGPRTDQCPAAFAPSDECLNYDEQFRTLVYAVWEGEPGNSLADSFRATVSWQAQRELRTLSRPSSNVENIGRDEVDTLGVTINAKTQTAQPWPWLRLRLSYGLDTYHDLLRSAAWIAFSDIDVTRQKSRGQYLDGSSYTYGGVFVDGSASLWDRRLRLQAGTRLSWIFARAPGDPASGSSAVDKAWFPLVGNAGVEWKTTEWLSLLFNVDRSFRAPNLDDMTSRQQTGPGFQFENPALTPEKATTLELGVRATLAVLIDVWVFHTAIDDAVIKTPREDSDCPPSTPRCRESWTRFQLTNAEALSRVWGVEASLFAQLPWGLSARSTFAWTWGDGPNVGEPPSDPSVPYEQRVPLSRVPPVNGTVELLWRHAAGLSISSALRWTTLQDRLALADVADERIPRGGTPGFVVVDVRATYRVAGKLTLSIALENLFDAAYRYHGSSVNGPGRGVTVVVDFGPLWRT